MSVVAAYNTLSKPASLLAIRTKGQLADAWANLILSNPEAFRFSICEDAKGESTSGEGERRNARMPSIPPTLANVLWRCILGEVGVARGAAKLGGLTANGAANTQKGGRVAVAQALAALGEAAVARLRAVPQPDRSDAAALLGLAMYCFHHNARLRGCGSAGRAAAGQAPSAPGAGA